MKKIILDLDNTITIHNPDHAYQDMKPNLEVISSIKKYKSLGYKITIFTARNMRTYKNDIQKIKKFTLPKITEWLEKYNVPYDDIIVGKVWCDQGFYVDDKAIRPSEFVNLSEDEILKIINE